MQDIVFIGVNHYFWDEPYLYRKGNDPMIRRIWRPIWEQWTSMKGLQSKFYWPTIFMDDISFFKQYDRYQRYGNISKR